MKKAIIVILIAMLAYMAAEWSVSLFTTHQLFDQEAQLVTNIYHGVAGRPWQYRILIPLIEPHVPQMAIYVGLYFLVFLGAYLYLGDVKNKLIAYVLSFAVVLLAHTRSGMAHSTYLDVALFMFGMYAVKREKYWWLLPIAIIGAVNRETILLLLGTAGLYEIAGKRERLAPIIMAFAVAVAVLMIIWNQWPQTFGNTDAHGNMAGFNALLCNLRYDHVAKFLSGTLFLPVISIPFVWKQYRWWGMGLLVINLLATFIAGECYETRMMLYSLLAVCIPAICNQLNHKHN